MSVKPSGILEMLRDRYPQLADHTNLWSPAELSFLSGVLATTNSLPANLVPAELTTRFIAVTGALQSAVRAHEGGNRQGHLSGRDVRELMAILGACSDEPFSEDEGLLAFIVEEDMRLTLSVDVAAAHRALGHGEWKAATVIAGSVIEALCLWAIRDRADEITAQRVASELLARDLLRRAAPGDLLKWHASELVETARALGFIGEDTLQVARTTVDYRNLIHPGREIRTGQRCTAGTAQVAIGTMLRVIEDLSTVR